MSEAVDNLVIRAATAVDVPAVVQMIGAVFDEYRFVYEPAIEVPDILTLETTYAAPHVFFVGVADGVVVGSVGVKRYPPNAAEIKRLYLAAAQRGKGWGRRLLEWSIGWAQAQHVQTITAWSDTRFTDAHRLYLRSGFTQDAERVLEDDPNDSREYRFVRNF